MNIIGLKNRIVNANNLYRLGVPILSDKEFDDLLEEYESLVSKSEYNIFRNSLHEKVGKIKHPFVMGSLDKVKYDEPDKLYKFINDYVKTTLNISAKIDGISCRLYYHKGILKCASTRGDGYFGEDITNKISYVKFIPKQIDTNIEDLNIRGELVILKSDFECMTDFSNARNACAGIINRKEFNKDDVSKISFIGYSILGNNLTKVEQFSILKQLGFNVAWNKDISVKNSLEIPKMLFDYATIEHEYETDGLVICDSKSYNEESYRPDSCTAFKINQLIGKTRLIDIIWQGPSKDGKFSPIGVVEPIELGGSIINKVTLNNIDYILELGIKYGSFVEICKRGDIIPAIVRVIDNESVK